MTQQEAPPLHAQADVRWAQLVEQMKNPDYVVDHAELAQYGIALAGWKGLEVNKPDVR